MRWIPATIAGWVSRLPPSSSLIETAVVVVIVADFARIVVRLIGLDGALGWDEAVYAVRARHWVDGEAALTGWSYIRAPLLPLIASVTFPLGSGEWALRTIGLASGTGLLVGMWLVGRMVAGPVAGVAAMAVMYSSPTLQHHSSFLLTDVPSAALLFIVIGIVWRELELKERPGPALALAAAIAGIAFLTRYGSVLALAPIVVLTVGLWWRRLLQAPRWPMAAAGVGLAFVVGHLVWSTMATGSPLGVIRGSQAVVPSWRGAEPFEMFQQWAHFEFAGTIGLFAIMAGFVAVPAAAAAAVLSARWSRPMRGMIFIATAGIAQVVSLIVGVAHVEQRYFIVAIAALVVAGVAVVALAVAHLPTAFRWLAIVAFAALVVVHRGPAVELAFDRTQAIGRYYAPFRLAGDAVRQRSSPPCQVVGGGGPIVAWYSGCLVVPMSGPPEALPDATGPRDSWFLTFAPIGDLDLSDPDLAAWLAHAGPPVAIRDPQSSAVIATLWSVRSAAR